MKGDRLVHKYYLDKNVVLKTDSKEYRDQLLLMISKTSKLEIISMTEDEIIIKSTVRAVSIQEMFPNIIKMGLLRYPSKRKKFSPFRRKLKLFDPNILCVSGIPQKKRYD